VATSTILWEELAVYWVPEVDRVFSLKVRQYIIMSVFSCRILLALKCFPCMISRQERRKRWAGEWEKRSNQFWSCCKTSVHRWLQETASACSVCHICQSFRCDVCDISWPTHSMGIRFLPGDTASCFVECWSALLISGCVCVYLKWHQWC